jgi:hypothetical protein
MYSSLQFLVASAAVMMVDIINLEEQSISDYANKWKSNEQAKDVMSSLILDPYQEDDSDSNIY